MPTYNILYCCSLQIQRIKLKGWNTFITFHMVSGFQSKLCLRAWRRPSKKYPIYIYLRNLHPFPASSLCLWPQSTLTLILSNFWLVFQKELLPLYSSPIKIKLMGFKLAMPHWNWNWYKCLKQSKMLICIDLAVLGNKARSRITSKWSIWFKKKCVLLFRKGW